MEKIKIVEFENRKGEIRFQVIDSETGRVIDNCQGYGYLSIQRAEAGYKYKSAHNTKQENSKRKIIKKWKEENMSFCNQIDNEMIYFTYKEGHPVKLTEYYLSKRLKEENITLKDFSAKELLFYW